MENDKIVATNKAEGLKHSITATGRQLGIVPAPQHGLFVIKYVDGKPGALPEKLQGRYTGVRFAKEHIDAFVAETWDLVADQLEKADAKKAKKKSSDESVAA